MGYFIVGGRNGCVPDFSNHTVKLSRGKRRMADISRADMNIAVF